MVRSRIYTCRDGPKHDDRASSRLPDSDRRLPHSIRQARVHRLVASRREPFLDPFSYSKHAVTLFIFHRRGAEHGTPHGTHLENRLCADDAGEGRN